MPADLLVLGARLFDPREPEPREGALAAEGGRIAFVGEAAKAKDLRGPRTRVVEVPGGLVMPGFHDAHAHISEGGVSLLEVDARSARSAEDLAGLCQARARELGPGAFITGRGWDDRRFADGRMPSAALLDAACPENPVLIRRHCGHAGVANHRMLALAGVGVGTADPPRGRIERLPGGEPQGMLFEDALELVKAAVPRPDRATRLRGLEQSLALARRFGVTSTEDEWGWPDLYEELRAAGRLTARARIWHRLEQPLEELCEWRARFPASEWLRPGLLKGYLDGSLGARTALFWEPYADAPDTSGLSTFEPERLEHLVTAADAAGFQVGLHAIGDRAVTRALDAFAAARRANGDRGNRHRVEHAQHVRLDDAPRFGALGAVASMQPSHLASDFAMVAPRLGPERLAGAYAWRTLAAAGAHLAFGSDFPIEPLDPRTSLYPAVTRRSYAGEGPLAPASEAVPLAAALRAFTMGSAFAAHEEAYKGTLAPGHVADLAIFRDDLFRLEPRDLLQAPLAMTVVGGRVVWEED